MIPRKPHTLRFENGPTGPRKRFRDGEVARPGQSPINIKNASRLSGSNYTLFLNYYF